MRTQKKTDNKSLELKVALRRRVIAESGLRELHVLDLCAGSGAIWREMREVFKIASYVPVDAKPRMKGTLKGNLTTRFLASFEMKNFNVVDVDTYGEPWLAWLDLSSQLAHRTIFFLTHGTVSGMGGCNISKVSRRVLGIPKGWQIPQKRELAVLASRYALTFNSKTVEFLKAYRIDLPNVTYYGLVCESKKT